MEKRGLATGDAVEVFNDRGSFKCRVKANESIRPGSARMFEGQTADFLIEGNVQSRTTATSSEAPSSCAARSSRSPIPSSRSRKRR